MKQVVWTAAVTFGVMGTACHKPVARVSGPSDSNEGVKVEIVNIECRRGTDDPDIADVVDLAMDLAITNGSNQIVHFRPNRVRVIDSGGETAAGTGWPVPIARGERRVMQVRFVDDRAGNCRERMRLDLADSLTLGQPIHEAPIGFIPEN